MSIGKRVRQAGVLALTLATMLVLVGCRQDMQDQPYYEPFEVSEVFANGSTNQVAPAGTVARGLYKDDDPHYWFGRDDSGNLVDELPGQLQWSEALLDRGRQRFDIYCSVCHDTSGAGRGMIVQRGFKQPQPLYEDRLRAQPLGYFYDVISHGFGIMPSYAVQVPVEDRWAIAAYVRVLQRSQGVPLDALPAELQDEFRRAMEAGANGDAGHGGGNTSVGSSEDHGGGH